MTNFWYVTNWDENGLGFLFYLTTLIRNWEINFAGCWYECPCFWSLSFLVAGQQSVHEPLCLLSHSGVKRVKFSCLLWNNANSFWRTICTVCFSFLQQLDRGGLDTQTDTLSRWLIRYWLPINPWLSLQLLVRYTHWPNHWATPEPIWLENSHRWQFEPGLPPEQKNCQ